MHIAKYDENEQMKKPGKETLLTHTYCFMGIGVKKMKYNTQQAEGIDIIHEIHLERKALVI